MMARLLVLVAGAALAAACPALPASTAVAPQQLTYSVDVPLPDERYDAGVCAVSPAGAATRLTPPHGRPLRDLAWAPDGRRLAYARSPVPDADAQVFVANADGSGERSLARGLAGISGDPAWSPDGRQVVFVAWGVQGIPQVLVAGPDGSGRRVLGLNIPGNPVQPAWAPNGRQLAVVAVRQAAAPGDLYLVDLNGGAGRLLATAAAEPAWSPDGRRIAYVSGRVLLTVDVNGTEVRAIGRDASSPAWSPDGRLIAFARDDAIVVVRPDGGGERAAVGGPVPARNPAWRRTSTPPAAPNRPCFVAGTSRADVLRGTTGPDVILAGAGSDTIFAGGGDDAVLAGSGDDFVAGEGGRDRLVGGFGRDRVYGGRGEDVLYARDAQTDLLDGGAGHDAAYFDTGVVVVRDRVRAVEALLGRP